MIARRKIKVKRTGTASQSSFKSFKSAFNANPCVWQKVEVSPTENYFPELNSEQLRLKFVLCNKMHKQYHQMFENVENADKLSKKNMKKFTEINENKPGLILMDPPELKLFGKITTQNTDGLLKEEQKLTMLQEQIKTRK
ncbi:Hypothetical_protein [Hexamita inflata]|uniref:Hypothetical_protein n=1 Tax=Hexamita inflata TaxID=28002 RepID=A0AA86PXG2_9EUKA|nr:Hypothetical protein HINF_LOCUS33203 [Hexamita inflata]